MVARSPVVLLTTESDVLGGAERMMVLLARGLRVRGIEVHFAGVPERDGWLTQAMLSEGVQAHAVPLRLGHRVETIRALREIAQRFFASVIHGHMMTMSFYGAVAGRLCGIPSVSTLHGTGPETATATRRFAMRSIMCLSNRSVSVSEGLRRELMTVVGPAARRMTVIWNGVESVPADRLAARSALGLADDAFVFLAVGNVLPVKGYDVLLSSAALLDKGAGWKLLIAGRHSDLSDRLIQERSRLGLDAQVQFLGTRDDVPQLLAAADVFVMPSRNEALPMALLEAMMAGKAVVASSVGGIPEAVKSGVNGLLVAPESPAELAGALARLLGNRAEVTRLGQAAAASVRQHFGMDEMVEAYLREYRLAGARI